MTTERPARWPLALLLPLVLAGAWIAAAMTEHHDLRRYGPADHVLHLLGCVETAWLSCDAIGGSAYSELFGVPQFTWAIPMYATLAGLVAAALAGRAEVLRPIAALGAFNVLYSALLAWLAFAELGRICTWCLALYAINLATPILALVAGAARTPPVQARVAGLIGGSWLLLAIVSIGGQRAYRFLAIDASAEPVGLLDAGFVARRGDAIAARSWEVTTETGRRALLTVDAGDPWRGDPDAPVAVVLFGDFGSPTARRAAAEVERLYARYADRAWFVYEHAPSDPACNPDAEGRAVDPRGCVAAEAATCAHEQGLFWPYHDLLYKHQPRLDLDDLRRYAVVVGADPERFDRCLRERRARADVASDLAHARAVDAIGGPRVFVGETVHHTGIAADALARDLELALGADPTAADEAGRAFAAALLDLPPAARDTPATREIDRDGLRFRIDTFEARIVDGVAVSAAGEIPARRISWFQARDACASAGKRLCTEEEWVTACQGRRAVDDDGDGLVGDDLIEGTIWPYGDRYDPRSCWDGKPEGFRPVYTGEVGRCVSADGVYDLTGNIAEWVGATPEEAALLGGAFDTAKERATCQQREATFGPGYASRRTGVRCCADAAAPGDAG